HSMTLSRPAIIGACIGGALHFFTVGMTVISSGANGERQGWLVFFADFPLVLLFSFFSLLNGPGYLLMVLVGGTLMYAFIGGLIGKLVPRYLATLRAAVGL